ncbi:ATPase with role in protein import into the ER [Ceratobasidium sp. 423]|nr:ATPase with role in protein import into the ER [Ceratobasidium sp. 423]
MTANAPPFATTLMQEVPNNTLDQALWIVVQCFFALGVLVVLGANHTLNSHKLLILLAMLYLVSFMLPADPHFHAISPQSAIGTRLFHFITWTLFLISGVFANVGSGDYGPSGPVIGIDLGTTYSCVGIYRNDRVEIIANSQGARTTPSWVSFRNAERIVGESAKHALHAYPSQTVYSVKRLIGRTFDDPTLLGDVARMTFKVANRTGRPVIQVKEHGTLREFTPEEVSATVLRSMKEIAEAYLGTEVTHAVITVPAYFNDAQRQATKDAGRIAGLTVLRILNEPTAAAIAYGLDRKSSGSSKVLVYDLGGGTFDVSLLQIQGENFKVLATAGDARLGGEDFDNRIVDYFAKLYRHKLGVDITHIQRSMVKLKKEAERAKRLLSNTMSVELDIESFYRGRDFSATLTRTKFEQLNIDLFRRTLTLVQRVLNDAKLTTRDVDEIVLVGGSTRIPKIHQVLKEMFGGKEPSQGINPDEAVAIGAAISGGMLSGRDGLTSVSLDDVCPFTIGIETSGGVFTPFIHHNSPVPISHSKTLSTLEDDQSTVLIQVYEGEHDRTEQNTLIGEFEMTGIPPAARGAVQLEVKFELDANGILFVGAKERFTYAAAIRIPCGVNANTNFSGSTKSITISSRRSGLSEEELNQLISKSTQYFGDSSGNDLEGNDDPKADRLSDYDGTAEDANEKFSLEHTAPGLDLAERRISKLAETNEGIASDHMVDVSRKGYEGKAPFALSVEQTVVLRAEKSRRIETLVRGLEERLSDRQHTAALTAMGTNITDIEVDVRDVQFWRMENEFTATLADLDSVIRILVELDQRV